MLTILGFVLAISIIVIIHELGHYFTARIFGVKVLEFSIGFGKELFSKIDKRGAKWKIAAIPLGGFVKMYGDADPASVNHIDVVDKNLTFYAKPTYVRFLIIAAGPIANYLLAILIFGGFYFSYGKLEIPAVVGEVIKDSPAMRAGVEADDKILAIDDQKIDDFYALQRKIIIHPDKPIKLLINRKGESKLLIVSPNIQVQGSKSDNRKTKTGFIGIKPATAIKFKEVGLIESIYLSIAEVSDISMLTLKIIGQIISNERSTSEIGGPLSIARESGYSLSLGIANFIGFIAMLSINVGLMNLLPVPILDGGHLIFIIYEMIAKKPLPATVQKLLLNIGMMVLIFLIVFSVSNDIKSLIF